MPEADRPLVFRPSPLLAASMALGLALWLIVFAYLFRFDGVPFDTFLSAGFFIVLFSAGFAYYGRTVVRIEGDGVTYRGLWRTRHVAFEEIGKVNVFAGPITVYSVRARGENLQFTSFFRQHRELANLLVERAQLAPAGR